MGLSHNVVAEGLSILARRKRGGKGRQSGRVFGRI